MEGEEPVGGQVHQDEEEEVVRLFVHVIDGGVVQLVGRHGLVGVFTHTSRHPSDAHQDVLLPLRVDVARRGVGRRAVEPRVDAPEEERRVGKTRVQGGGAVGDGAAAVGGARPPARVARQQGLSREVEEEEVGGVPPEVRVVCGGAGFVGGDGREDLVDADQLCVIV